MRSSLSARLLTAAVTLFRAEDVWTDAAAAVFAARLLPLVQGAQRALAGLAAAHVAAAAAAVLARPVAPPAVVSSAMVGLRPGIDPALPYRRPFVTVRVALSRGDHPVRAQRIAEDRLRRTTDMDLQLTYAESSRAAMRALPDRDRPRGWARVPTGRKTCPLCLAAAGKVYDADERSPVHALCNCLIRPVYDASPISSDVMDAAANAAAALTGRTDIDPEDLADPIETIIRHHGEYGAVLRRP